MAFSILLDPRAVEDIQESVDYYEDQEAGLGKRFEEYLDQHLSVLKENPFFQVRYDEVHCLPLSQFSHMIHYTIDEKNTMITVRAVFHTARDPQKWEGRGDQ